MEPTTIYIALAIINLSLSVQRNLKAHQARKRQREAALHQELERIDDISLNRQLKHVGKCIKDTLGEVHELSEGLIQEIADYAANVILYGFLRRLDKKFHRADEEGRGRMDKTRRPLHSLHSLRPPLEFGVVQDWLDYRQEHRQEHRQEQRLLRIPFSVSLVRNRILKDPEISMFPLTLTESEDYLYTIGRISFTHEHRRIRDHYNSNGPTFYTELRGEQPKDLCFVKNAVLSDEQARQVWRDGERILGETLDVDEGPGWRGVNWADIKIGTGHHGWGLRSPNMTYAQHHFRAWNQLRSEKFSELQENVTKRNDLLREVDLSIHDDNSASGTGMPTKGSGFYAEKAEKSLCIAHKIEDLVGYVLPKNYDYPQEPEAYDHPQDSFDRFRRWFDSVNIHLGYAPRSGSNAFFGPKTPEWQSFWDRLIAFDPSMAIHPYLTWLKWQFKPDDIDIVRGFFVDTSYDTLLAEFKQTVQNCEQGIEVCADKLTRDWGIEHEKLIELKTRLLYLYSAYANEKWFKAREKVAYRISEKSVKEAMLIDPSFTILPVEAATGFVVLEIAKIVKEKKFNEIVEIVEELKREVFG